MNVFVEIITKNDLSSLLEFDAVFIRETTAIGNHTYTFARKAEQEDIPCLDDTQSIILCCNKVFLHELMSASKIPMPNTIILDKKKLSTISKNIVYPAVLKIPDGSFSRGVVKANDYEDLVIKAKELLDKSEFILLQEFVKSDFDWRIGILNNQPLFAIKYYMSKGHWQIYNHDQKNKKDVYGEHECLPLEEVPERVMDLALKATKKIGAGLYGVDIKETREGRVVLIEVNDNPNIDNGVEDSILGDELYKTIINRFIYLIENLA